MDKKMMIDKIVDARLIVDEIWATADEAMISDLNRDNEAWEISYRVGLVLDEIDALLNYLEDNDDV